MALNTASEVISFARRLEEDSAKLYENLAQQYTKIKETLLSFATENRKNIVQMERAYYGVITDAIEGCFAFNLNQDDYEFQANPADAVSYTEALAHAIEIEEKIKRFYSEAASQAKSLLADLPRVFALIAKKRESRSLILKSLLSGHI